ncbi:alpha/beta-hydrolase [Mycena rosella]|uniref:Alpha/beta-hydrolase n=1 Tax=Mycena rosella TaxID=1033263 RepID=A0AAD7H225_MYCRO|nr:alpha/beta-hydrolase [Mycena rosella]
MVQDGSTTTEYDIPYIPNNPSPLLRFDLYAPDACPRDSPLLVFVHGGAWRAEDKADNDFRTLASRLASASNCPVLVPNYRLTTEHNQFRHPGHAADILAFLVFLTTWPGVPNVFDPAGRPMYLMGHSAGAHILTSIFLDSAHVFPSLTPPSPVLQAVRAIVLSEGIYDIDLLLARFPEYRGWFIAAAFGDRESYADVSTTSLSLREGSDLRWLVIHSAGDTLVDMPQSDTMDAHLRGLYGPAADTRVARNFDQLDVDHDDVLRSPLFVDVVRAFVDGLQ